jgi:hypothetical protein
LGAAFGFLEDIERVFEAAVATVPVLGAWCQSDESFPAGRYVPAAGDLISASAAQIAHQVRKHALSPVDIAEFFLAHRGAPAPQCFHYGQSGAGDGRS